MAFTLDKPSLQSGSIVYCVLVEDSASNSNKDDVKCNSIVAERKGKGYIAVPAYESSLAKA
eukprot:1162117-Pelagomonas_calceolata.AAC.2